MNHTLEPPPPILTDDGDPAPGTPLHSALVVLPRGARLAHSLRTARGVRRHLRRGR